MNDFGNGEAQTVLPYNFSFTMKVLEKLRNFNILDKKNVAGSVKWSFTGRNLESTHNITPPVEDIKKKWGLREREDCPPCKWCKSTNVIKKGSYNGGQYSGVQRYKCNDCGRHFSDNDNPYRFKHPEYIIREALVLHDDDHSLREISTILKEAHGIDISHVTIKAWIDDFNDGILILNDLCDEKPEKPVKIKKEEVGRDRMDEKRNKIDLEKYFLKIKRLLGEHGKRKLYQSEIKDLTGLSVSETSVKLMAMVDEGWLESHRDGNKKVLRFTRN